MRHRMGLTAAIVASLPFAASSSLDSETIVTINAAVTPPPSAGHSLVYADDLEVVLLVNAGLGGMDSPPAASRTKLWAWNGKSWTVLDSAGPPVRNMAGVTYDSRRRVLVMHGGTYDRDTHYGDTWEWSRATGWRHIAANGPGVRHHTQMTFDPERGRTVLFGGSGTDISVALDDTWEFDGARWERVATGGPPGRVHHAMQYDPALRRVVLFGGTAPGRGRFGDTWTWDGSRWTLLPSAAPPRTHARMAFHRKLNRMLIVGSLTGLPTMTRSDTGWEPLTSSGEPSTRYLSDVAYDAKRDVLVLFGGGAGNSLFSDTWEFDGTSWSKKS
jgi:hypothetical protein